MATIAVPTVNMSHDKAAVTTIREACEKIGFFYLEGHGISDELMARTFAASAAFFHLPMEEKRKLLADKNNRGYTNLGEEVLDPSGPKEGEHKEGYYICREIDPSSPEAELPLHGPNQWPDDKLLPGWRATMSEYFDACHAVGVRVISLLARSLGLPEDHFKAAGFFDKPQLFLRLLRYGPAEPDADGALHAGGHTDYGMITLLATDENPGLQVLPRGSTTWVDVPPKRGAFIVNLGDMCEVFANGKYVSTVHRVVMVNGKERFSIPFFMEPNYHCVVEPLACCVTPDSPAKYEPVQAGKWVLGKYGETHKEYKVPDGVL